MGAIFKEVGIKMGKMELVTPEMVGQVMKDLGTFDKIMVPGSIKATMAESGGKSADLWKVPRSAIKAMPGFNVRIRDEQLTQYIRELADSIKANGFFPDSVLAGYVANEGGTNVIYSTDGHMRLEAVDIANAEGANVDMLPIVISKGASKEDLTARLVTKNSGRRLTKFEKAVVVKRLADYGWDNGKIKEKTGIAPQECEQLLMLMAAPAEVRKMVESGEVAAGVAVAEMKSKGDGAVASLQKMKVQAKAKGHGQVTERHREGAGIRKVIRREGENMLNTLRQLTKDPAFQVVSEELKTAVDKLLAKFEEQEKKEAAALAGAGNKEGKGKAKVAGKTGAQKATTTMSKEAEALASF